MDGKYDGIVLVDTEGISLEGRAWALLDFNFGVFLVLVTGAIQQSVL